MLLIFILTSFLIPLLPTIVWIIHILLWSLLYSTRLFRISWNN
nr:MAG TPA: hypothetical protein [Bacteriophage sp.]